MPALTRRRNDDPHRQGWHVYCADVRVGWIGERAGVPKTGDQWGWSCGFYPGLEPGQHWQGTGVDFEAARAGFQWAWEALLPDIPPDAFDEWRRARAFHVWKERMWETGCRLPTQMTSGRSCCFCGEEISIAGVSEHVYATHIATR